jgi:glycosyltransferase involved in cell wall biosynthesis
LKKILVSTDTYLPGFKGGGPVKTIKNLIDLLNKDYSFYVITSDRDIGDKDEYEGIEKNKWLNKGIFKINYLDKKNKKLLRLKNHISSKYDVIYMNSMFSKFSVFILVLLKLKFIKVERILLAPRGELSDSSLNYRKYKKKIFLTIFKFFNLYSRVIFQSTSIKEKIDINQKLNIDLENIYLIPNISGIVEEENFSDKKPGSLSIVYVSRIHPVKNLKFIFKVLKEIKDINITFDFYGPMENEKYFSECLILMNELESNIQVNYLGPLEQSKVQQKISEYNLFFLPTLGENFGHSIVESLLTNTPVLVSDQTPWNSINDYNAGRAINLSQEQMFIDYINYLGLLDEKDYNSVKDSVKKFKNEKILQSNLLIEYKKLFN